MFYKLAPRRRTTFREVWVGALLVALLLRVLQTLFILYAKNIAHFNAVYGAFGSVIAVLMWVYLSGSVIILGGCFCAATAEAPASCDTRRWTRKGKKTRNPKIRNSKRDSGRV